MKLSYGDKVLLLVFCHGFKISAGYSKQDFLQKMLIQTRQKTQLFLLPWVHLKNFLLPVVLQYPTTDTTMQRAKYNRGKSSYCGHAIKT